MTETETRSSFARWLKEQAPSIQAALAQALQRPSLHAAPAQLRAAMDHALLGGGKGVRPALVLLGCAACGGSAAQALPAAVAVEMIHAYSLVHDDLPSMDDDALRRGRPTVHAQFGEACAVLAGDALQALAFEVLAEQTDAALGLHQVALLSHACGAAGMVGGQALDMELEGAAEGVPLAAVEAVHEAKTGALLACSLRLGVAAAGAPANPAWEAYAVATGRLFQATDDLLDATRSTSDLGKTAGKDEAAGKATLIAALGLDGARRYALQLAESARTAVDGLGAVAHSDALTDLPRFLLDRIR